MSRSVGLWLLLVACGSEPAPVGGPPVVSILTPVSGQVVGEGPVELLGAVSDPDGVDDIASVRWSSSLAGELVAGEAALPDEGYSRAQVLLTAGVHQLVLQATDTSGATTEAQLELSVVGDGTPTVMFVQPAAGSVFFQGDDIDVLAQVASHEHAADELSVALSVQHEGGSWRPIEHSGPTASGEVTAELNRLPRGDFALRLEVSDAEGDSSTATVAFRADVGVEADGDGDGQTVSQGDCDDSDATVYDGAPELEDGIDNDCDGHVDEGTARFDADGDCFCPADSCTNSAGDCATVAPGDCDDTDASVHPGASEAPDGRDEDCDGAIDEDTPRYDHDGDCACAALSGSCSDGVEPDCASLVLGDCDDEDPAISPLAEEQCTEGVAVDDDCDGVVDNRDVDLDGYIDAACTAYVGVDGGDCDDTRTDVAPGLPDLPSTDDGYLDANCDGIDGELDEAVFVSSMGEGTLCTREDPCPSVDEAFERMVEIGGSQILLFGRPRSPGFTVDQDVIIAHGYSSDFSTRSPYEEMVTRLVFQSELVVSGAVLTLQNVHVSTASSSSLAYASSIRVLNGELYVEDALITGAGAAAGDSGFSTELWWHERAPDGDDGVSGSGLDLGEVVEAPDNPDCEFAGSGGYGGTFGRTSRAGGRGGVNSAGFAGGVGGGSGSSEPLPGHGRNGADGEDGEPGQGGTAWRGTTGLPARGNGTIGYPGTPGDSGAGGGGSGGTVTLRGNTGASGGAPGCGAAVLGPFGTGGQHAMTILAIDSAVYFAGEVIIDVGQGGAGGRGGAPRPGQEGGLGGESFPEIWVRGRPRPGGAGGDGGHGGASGGGGGGAGGNSYGVFGLESLLDGVEDVTFRLPSPAAGGVCAPHDIINAHVLREQLGGTGEDGLLVPWVVHTR